MSTAASPLTPMTPTGETNKPLLTLTDAAIEKVKYFASTMPDSTDKPLRIFVLGHVLLNVGHHFIPAGQTTLHVMMNWQSGISAGKFQYLVDGAKKLLRFLRRDLSLCRGLASSGRRSLRRGRSC